MDTVNNFRERLREVLQENSGALRARVHELALLQVANSSLVQSNTAVLKERDALLVKTLRRSSVIPPQLQEAEQVVVSTTRDAEAKVAAFVEDKQAVQKKNDALTTQLQQTVAELSTVKEELTHLKMKALLEGAESGLRSVTVGPAADAGAPPKASTQAVEVFMDHVRTQMSTTVSMAEGTAEQAKKLSERVSELEAMYATARLDAAQAVANIQALSDVNVAMEKALTVGIRSSSATARANAKAAETARAAAEAERKAAVSAADTLKSNLEDKTALVQSLQTQLAAASETHAKRSDMLAQATEALKAQDGTLQKLRAELLALHDACDKHDGAVRKLQAEHTAIVAAKDTALAQAQEGASSLRSELAKVKADAALASAAATTAHSEVQAELIAARHDCARARQELVACEERLKDVQTQLVEAQAQYAQAQAHLTEVQAQVEQLRATIASADAKQPAGGDGGPAETDVVAGDGRTAGGAEVGAMTMGAGLGLVSPPRSVRKAAPPVDLAACTAMAMVGSGNDPATADTAVYDHTSKEETAAAERKEDTDEFDFAMAAAMAAALATAAAAQGQGQEQVVALGGVAVEGPMAVSDRVLRTTAPANSIEAAVTETAPAAITGTNMASDALEDIDSASLDGLEHEDGADEAHAPMAVQAVAHRQAKEEAHEQMPTTAMAQAQPVALDHSVLLTAEMTPPRATAVGGHHEHAGMGIGMVMGAVAVQYAEPSSGVTGSGHDVMATPAHPGAGASSSGSASKPKTARVARGAAGTGGSFVGTAGQPGSTSATMTMGMGMGVAVAPNTAAVAAKSTTHVPIGPGPAAGTKRKRVVSPVLGGHTIPMPVQEEAQYATSASGNDDGSAAAGAVEGMAPEALLQALATTPAPGYGPAID